MVLHWFTLMLGVCCEFSLRVMTQTVAGFHKLRFGQNRDLAECVSGLCVFFGNVSILVLKSFVIKKIPSGFVKL